MEEDKEAKHLIREKYPQFFTTEDQLPETPAKTTNKTLSVIPHPRLTTESPILSSELESRGRCQGLYNPPAFFTLSKICHDCYNLYMEHEVHSLCMSDCFSSSYFFYCAKSLLKEEDKVLELVRSVGK